MFQLSVWSVYLILLLLSILNVARVKIPNAFNLSFSFLLIAFLSVIVFIFAPDFSRDYLLFKNWYELVPEEKFGLSWVSLKDPAFFFFATIFNSLGLSYAVMNFAYCLISLVTIFYIFNLKEYRKYLFFISLIYVSRFYLGHEFTQIRFAVAISLSTMAYVFLTQGKNIKFFIFVVLALSFHLSAALIIIPLLSRFLPRERKGRSFIIIFIMFIFSFLLIFDTSSLTFLVNSIPLVAERVLPYINGSYDVTSFRILTTYFSLKLFLLLIVSFCFLREKGNVDSNFINYYYTVAISCCIHLFFKNNDALAIRIIEYFSLFDIFFMLATIDFLYIRGFLFRVDNRLIMIFIMLLTVVWLLSGFKLFD
ncbi:EpsG family protein [Pectobacterium aroidearum]|uniref:EpsG family protein n=1 Tax=Pectobacterium aroidearum TaxID=1201031 RepID=UPI001CD35520|nr:EpsG family protein [Pectobacterium aroidearum]